MAASSPIQTCFNAGELSPLIAGRIDYQKYVNGCKTMQNFIPTVQGPAKNRPGLHFVSEVALSGNKTWLVPFVFSETTAFILEFGPFYIRFYLQHGQLQSGGSPYQVLTPFTSADLTNPDGTFGLSFAQSGDVIYIATANQPPQKLIRISNTNWTINSVLFTNGPYLPVNPLNSITVSSSVLTGSGTLTASSGIFQASDVGTNFYIQDPLNPSVNIGQWTAGTSVLLGQYAYSGLNLYQAQNAGTTGNVQPIHTQGVKTDGTPGVSWVYCNSGYATVLITGYTSPTQVSISVTAPGFVPPNASGAYSTTLWAKSAWSASVGFPTAVTFFRGRLCWAKGTQLFCSVAADFENMATKDFGIVSDDMAIIINIASDRYDQIVWLAAVDVLLVGTVGSEYAVAEASSGSAFGPLNVQAKQQTGNGGRAVAPVVFNSSTLFVQRAGRKLREIRYSFATNNYQSIDLTVLSEHITQNQIVDMDFQQEPNYIVWCALANGQLVGLTYCREQDTVGWHEHVIGSGNVAIECVSCIPTPDGTGDEMWCIANIVVNGVTRRYICYLDQGWNTSQNPWDPFYLDLGATYNGINTGATTLTLTDNAGSPTWNFPDPCTLTASAATFSANDVGGFVNLTYQGFPYRINITAYVSATVVTGIITAPIPVGLQGVATTSWTLAPLVIGGLTYLQGQTVGILGDGAPQPNQVVSNTGTITLQYPAGVVQVGLPYTSTLTSMRFSGGGQTGSGQGMLKRITHCIFRFLNTLGGQYGNDGGPYDAFEWRSSFNVMNEPPPLFTGDVKVEWNASTDFDGYVSVQQQQPLPMTVVAVMPQMFVNDPQT